MVSSINARDAAAKAAIAEMWSNDRASPGLGMRLEHVGSGEARVSMPIVESMLNGLGTCHGGFIFALADSAFAFACNSHNQYAVAQHCFITYVNPAHAGDILTATAKERSLAGRNGVYDVTVVGRNGTTIAEFRGLSRSVKGQHLSTDDKEN